MMATELRPGVDWVGYVDNEIKDFHGYRTERGSTYNAYLVRDEKTAIIDTVKGAFADRLLARVSALVDLAKVDYVVCNHAEPDHSSSLPVVMKACPSAEVVCTEKCKSALSKHFDVDGWRWRIVSDGESLSLGSRNLFFIETPMVHWPESTFTYIPEDKLLFSMDAFGQHYASQHRFDDEEPLDVIMEEAKTYYANIVMLYGKIIKRVLDRAAGLDIEMIAPSHGVIWRKNLDVILAAYEDWVVCKAEPKVLVIYDTMWQSTQRMAQAIAQGATRKGIEVKLYNAREEHITTIATEMFDCAAAAFGSPTLNMTLMPQMAAILTYLKGLRPVGKSGFAFGSYGWSKGGARDIQQYLEAIKVNILCEPIEAQYVPDAEVIEKCIAAGHMLAEEALKV